MFKRYKNPLEKDVSNSPFPGDSGAATATLPRPPAPEQQPSYLPPSAPPRMFNDKQSPVASPYSTPNAYATPRSRELEPPVSAAPSEVHSVETAPLLHNEEPDTTLGEGVVFKGELTFRKLLRIDGQFEGDLVSEGKLIIGPTGVVKSNIIMREAIIEGKVEGNVSVTDRLELRNNAQIFGNIEARLLSIDEGVTLVGQVSVKPEG